MSNRASTLVHLVSAPLFFGAILAIPSSAAEFGVRCSLGLLVWMAWWWVARPVHLAVTAFLPLVVVSLFDVIPIDDLLPAYASQLVILLLGANLITTTWSKWGLDRRIALLALNRIGARNDIQISVWFVLAAVFSAVLPNTVVAAAMLPIAIALIRCAGIEQAWENRFATTLLIAVAWGTSAGGMATPLGGAPNLLAVEYLQQVTGREFLYTTWVTRLLPMMLVVSVTLLIYIRMTFEVGDVDLTQSAGFSHQELQKLGPMCGAEKWCLLLFACPLALAFTRSLYASVLPNLQPPFAFLAFGILVFIVRHRGESLLSWEDAQERMMWGLIYLFAGGTALGQLLSKSGAASYIAGFLVDYAAGSSLLATFVIALITIVLTQVTSNTAAVAIIMPITISTFQSLDCNPVPSIYIVAAVANCGFALPSSAGGPAVAAGYGANLQTMLVKGLGAAILVMVLIVLCGFALSCVWPAFSEA